jgi:sulfate transport system ATP-binding protein
MSVVVRGLTKTFGARAPAVAGVGFEAPSGKVTSILGPSGSGKSTVLRMIAGLETPDDGRILLDGADITRASPSERGVGFVFQSYALFGHMTVRDNIAFGLKIRGASRSEVDDRVRELLSSIQLVGYEKRLPKQLSGGQRQRVALARALATRPRLLLLDEPFGALDAQVRSELREWLVELHDRTRVTTLLVTHDQEEALEVSDHIVLLRGGEVVQAGAPHDLYDRPATPFAASFLGATNVLSPNSNVRAFIRPEDVRLEKASASNGDGSLARIERMTRIGGQVRIALALPTGETLTVQLTKPDADLLDVALGDRVVVDLREAKVFDAC